MKRLLKGLAGLVVLLGILYYLLLPSQPIKSEERFGAWQEKTNFVTLVQQAVSNLTSTDKGLTSKMVISNLNLKSILNDNLTDQQKSSLADTAIDFSSSYLTFRQPLLLGGLIKSQLTLGAKVLAEDGQLVVQVESARLGKIPLPHFFLKQVLKEKELPSNFDLETLSLPISLPGEGYRIESIEIQSKQAIVYLSFDRERLLSFLESQLQQ